MENNKMMLLYGFRADEQKDIKELSEALGITQCKIIENTMMRMKVEDIIKGFKFETEEQKVSREKVVLFNNFEDDVLNNAIAMLRTNLNPRPILAVITETSIGWEFKDLLEHLIEEKEWFLKNKK